MIVFKNYYAFFLTRGITYYLVNTIQVVSYCKTVVYFMMLYRPHVMNEFTVETTFIVSFIVAWQPGLTLYFFLSANI